jgi:hypothetical protein
MGRRPATPHRTPPHSLPAFYIQHAIDVSSGRTVRMGPSPQGRPKLAFVVREWQVSAARATARRVLQADGATHAAIVLPALSMPRRGGIEK